MCLWNDWRGHAAVLLPLVSSGEVEGGGHSQWGPVGGLSISLALCLTRWHGAPGEGRGRKDPSPNRLVCGCVGVSHLPPTRSPIHHAVPGMLGQDEQAAPTSGGLCGDQNLQDVIRALPGHGGN